MTNNEVDIILQNQKTYFKTLATHNIEFRIENLKKLKSCIIQNQQQIFEALYNDLGKSANESYMAEVGMVLEEITFVLKKLRGWSKPKKVATPLAQFPSKSFKVPTPYGVCLILSPWNYPFMLAMSPLVDCLAAGNTAILKPSQASSHTLNIITKIVQECFEQKYVCVLNCEHEQTNYLTEQKLDYIFFTGSENIGKQIMRRASLNLVPVSLELGGKSPCIVDKTANLKLTAKRIVFGKFLNAGQTCVAPDYIYIDKSVEKEFLTYAKNEIINQFGIDPLKNNNYGKIISSYHLERLVSYFTNQQDIKVEFGGNYDSKENKIEPTLLTNVTENSSIMQQEIFGPILPILTYENLNDVFEKLQNKPSPLAFYFFSNNKCNIKKFQNCLSFGGGCINDTIIHIASTALGFGGVGASGMGSYHGKNGFDTFSHYKSIVNKKQWLDLPFRYAPYSKIKDKLIRMFLK